VTLFLVQLRNQLVQRRDGGFPIVNLGTATSVPGAPTEEPKSQRPRP